MRIEEVIKLIEGQTVEYARNILEFNGMVMRIIKQDGEAFMCTMDLHLSRVNVVVDNGIITEVRSFG